MTIERGDSTIAKNLKGKVQAVTYAANTTQKDSVTIDGVKYVAKLDADLDIYPGVKVEHAPYVERGSPPVKATRIVKLTK